MHDSLVAVDAEEAWVRIPPTMSPRRRRVLPSEKR